MDPLEKRVALVTGGGRGIGRGIALALAQAGAEVAVNYRERREAAELVCAEIRRRGRRSFALQADVAVPAEARRLVDEATAALGPVEILVNNAGVARTEALDEITEESWNAVLDVNLKSAFFVSQAALPAMRRRRWGRIVNISSAAAHLGGIVGAHYAASKAGLLGLTHALARALAPEGITVNAVAPALIETEMIAGIAGARPEIIPLGRLGSVAEVAGVVVLLARDGYITGQTIGVDGGAYMT